MNFSKTAILSSLLSALSYVQAASDLSYQAYGFDPKVGSVLESIPSGVVGNALMASDGLEEAKNSTHLQTLFAHYDLMLLRSCDPRASDKEFKPLWPIEKLIKSFNEALNVTTTPIRLGLEMRSGPETTLGFDFGNNITSSLSIDGCQIKNYKLQDKGKVLLNKGAEPTTFQYTKAINQNPYNQFSSKFTTAKALGFINEAVYVNCPSASSSNWIQRFLDEKSVVSFVNMTTVGSSKTITIHQDSYYPLLPAFEQRVNDLDTLFSKRTVTEIIVKGCGLFLNDTEIIHRNQIVNNLFFNKTAYALQYNISKDSFNLPRLERGGKCVVLSEFEVVPGQEGENCKVVCKKDKPGLTKGYAIEVSERKVVQFKTNDLNLIYNGCEASKAIIKSTCEKQCE